MNRWKTMYRWIMVDWYVMNPTDLIWFDMIWCSVVTSLLRFLLSCRSQFVMLQVIPLRHIFQGDRVVDSAWKRRNAKGCQRIQRSLYIVLRCAKDFSRQKKSACSSQFFNPRHVQQIQWPLGQPGQLFRRIQAWLCQLLCLDAAQAPLHWCHGPAFPAFPDPTCCTAEQVPKLQLNSLPLPAQWLGLKWFISGQNWWFIDHELMCINSSQIWVCKDSVIEEGLISVPNCWFVTSLSQVQPLHGEQRRTFLLSCLRLGCWANDNNVHIVLESKGKFFMMPLFTRLDEATSAKCLS